MKIAVGIICAVLILYLLSIVVMLLWGFLTSLKSESDFIDNVLGLPKTIKGDEYSSYYTLFQFKNYTDVIRQFHYTADTSFYSGQKLVQHVSEQNFFTMLMNSLLYSLGNGFLQAIIPAIMAYMCAKYPYKFSKAVYMVVLIVMTLPIVGAYPSELLLLRNLGLYDTWYGNFIPCVLRVFQGHAGHLQRGCRNRRRIAVRGNVQDIYAARGEDDRLGVAYKVYIFLELLFVDRIVYADAPDACVFHIPVAFGQTFKRFRR